MGYYTQENFSEYFWNRFDKTETCWLWKGRTKQPQCYGTIRIKGKDIYIHRLAYELTYGDISEGLVVRHTCDVKHCGNPAHLELGTQSDNVKDSVSRGRISRGVDRYNSKNSENDIITMRKRFWIDKVSYAQLARDYKLNESTVKEIVQGNSWKHLPNFKLL
jgi:hypothetical protein